MIQLHPPFSTTFNTIQYPNNPFHIGEITLQKSEQMHDHVMSYAPQFIRSYYMPDQHRQFYNDLPFLVVAIRDPITGYMWSTLFENTNHSGNDSHTDDENNVVVATSPDPQTLLIHARPVVGDALEHVFDFDTSVTTTPTTTTTNTIIDVGILGIQFETARRNRVNGRITIQPQSPRNNENPSDHRYHHNLMPLIFKVDQSFGNCPQYIKPRKGWYRAEVSPTFGSTTTSSPATTTHLLTPITSSSSNNTKKTNVLSLHQIQWIETTETFFTATGFRNLDDPNHNTNARYGNDASHRGGPPGFVKVVTVKNEQDDSEYHEIVWTEFSGNHHFNSLGNLIVDARIGLCFPNFHNGGMLQISGTATVQMGNLQDGERQVHMSILAINEVLPGSLPIRWPLEKKKHDADDNDENWKSLEVIKIVQESKNVKSFYFHKPPSSALSKKTNFRAGQHLPIQLINNNDGNEVLDRRYSISSSPYVNDYYRISVKLHEYGKSSNYLHHHVKVGDHIKTGQPGGGFILNENNNSSTHQSIVLISAGIGITPLLSMLHELISSVDEKHPKKIYWIHGAKNSLEHPFQNEMNEIQEKFASNHHPPNTLQVHTLYSTPEPNDKYDKVGRITAEYIRDVVPNLIAATTDDNNNVSIYMCGPLPFLADMETGLVNIGVDNSHIHYETF